MELIPVDHDPFANPAPYTGGNLGPLAAPQGAADAQPFARNTGDNAGGADAMIAQARAQLAAAMALKRQQAAPPPDQGESWSGGDLPVSAPRPATPLVDGMDWTDYNKPTGEARQSHYKPSERIGNAVADSLMYAGMAPYTANDLTKRVGNVLGWTPAGAVTGAADAIDAKQRGDIGGTVEGMAGMIPGVKGAARVAGGKLEDILKRSSQIPNIRELPAEEAIAAARKEPHLIKAGDQSEGYYVGGPRDLGGKRGLTNTRGKFDEYVAADPRGGDWYDRYRQDVRDVTGNDPVHNKWMANQEAQWSAGVSPEGEFGFAVKENNAALAGMPTKAARPAQHKAHMEAIAAQDPDQYQLGKKTAEYARLVNPDQARPPGTTGVNDFRHARNFNYTDPNGGPQREGMKEAQHKFLDYETTLAVDRANKSKLGGRSDWTGEQLQAAPWVRQKALDIQKRNPNLSYDDAFKRANTTIGDFYDKHTAFATHEAMPGADTGHLPGSLAAPLAERAAYSADPRSTWANAPGGRDAIYSGMSIPGTGVGMRVRPTTEMQGLYTPPGGATETNPGWTARPLVGFNSGKTKSVADADQALLNAGEATRGAIDAQNASAWHKHWAGGKPGDSNSLFLPLQQMATEQQLKDVQKISSKYGLPDVADTGQGITATSFWPPPENINAAVRKGEMGRDLRAVTGGDMTRTKVDSNLIDYVPHWKEGEGSGAVTREMLTHINATPEIRAAINNNPNIPQNSLNRLERDADWAKKWGAPRQDVQELRRIIGAGPGWVDRVEAALKAGAILPAVAAAFFAGTAKDPSQASGRGERS